MTTGLFIGRFQPMHKAHLQIVREILRGNEGVIIGIGSAQYYLETKNPFSSNERVKFIEKVMQKEGITSYEIKIISDINDNSRWVHHVKKITGNFDKVYTMNPIVKKLFEEDNVEVVWLKKIEGISSTEVRKRMSEDKNWQELVPDGIVKCIEKIDGVNRIKKLMG